ncbi:MAG: 50S ribosomal protein L6 [Myxococcales bacterium]
MSTDQVSTVQDLRLSRVGKRPVVLPKGVTFALKDGRLEVKGPKGELVRPVTPNVSIKVEDTGVHVSPTVGGRDGARFQGLARALLQGMVDGVANGYTKTLQLVGTGYRAEVKVTTLHLALGFSHPVVFPIPLGIKIEIPAESKGTMLVIRGSDKEKIGQTAEILSRMNNQFTGTQDALKELIDLSKITTKNQLSEGSAELKRMVNNLDSTMSTIETRFADLSDTMRKSIEGSAEKSSQAADGIITKVGELNQQSVEKFMEVLNKHEGQLDRVDQLKEKLQSAVEEFGTYVTGYNEINAGMRYVAEDVKIAMNSLSSSVQKMKESQDSIKDVAELAASQVKELNTSQELQVETWMNIETSMERYREVFDTVEKSASHVLSDITLHLQQFSSATQDHFNKTVTVANDHVTHAVGQLGAAIDGLSEKLEELGEVAEEISSIKNQLTK